MNVLKQYGNRHIRPVFYKTVVYKKLVLVFLYLKFDLNAHKA